MAIGNTGNVDNSAHVNNNIGILSHLTELGLDLNTNYSDYEKYLIGNMIIPPDHVIINKTGHDNDINTTQKNKDFILNIPNIKLPPLHLPGHNWLGPGTDVKTNLLYEVQPVDIDDRIARQHDIDYNHAKTREDIILADSKMVTALQNAREHGLIDDDFGATLAEYIIAGKNAIDRVTNNFGFITYGDPTDERMQPNSDL